MVFCVRIWVEYWLPAKVETVLIKVPHPQELSIRRWDALFRLEGITGEEVDHIAKINDVPTLGHGADFGLFLGFVAEAFGEELVHEGLFQLGGGLNDSLLRFDGPLHRRKDVRDLLLLGECRENGSCGCRCMPSPGSDAGTPGACPRLILVKV